MLFSMWCVHAKKDGGPRITPTEFDTPPTSLDYFDDTDTILVLEGEVGILWRSEDGGEKWQKIKDIDRGKAAAVFMHPCNNTVAYVLSGENEHWATHDQGKTWISFETGDATPAQFRSPLSFHAGDSKKVLLNSQRCRGRSCTESTYYTTDAFKTTKKLRDDTRGCYFAHSTPLFKASDDKDDNRILCVAKGRYSSSPMDARLLISDDYFENESEPLLERGRTVQGIISMAVVKSFLVAAARTEGTSELALYVTDDAKTWHRAEFPNNHKLEEEAYTILESTNYSVQVDVLTTKRDKPMGVLFSSNSNGTYFTEMIQHTNRNFGGNVDFEKMQGIQGIIFVNVVDNWKEVEEKFVSFKKVKSRISFDDGRTFKPIFAGKEELHLHSVTDMSNSGRVYSSTAPGLAMGIGNTGDFLKSYDEGDLYVSNDAGLTWKKALEEAHKYEFGDQGSVLVAVYDEGEAKEIMYSTNHGRDWASANLDASVRPKLLTTTPDSTSLKFVLVGTVGGGSTMKYQIFSIDFADLHEGKCKKADFEKWYARLDSKGEPDCLMGRKQYYMRRKAQADCFVQSKFEDPEPQYEVCVCSAEDFECDYNFVKDEKSGKCLPQVTLPVPEGACKEGDDTYKGTSGLRLIPGNFCERKGGVELDKEIDRPCGDTVKKPISGKVSHEITSFRANGFDEYYYLERTVVGQGEDETVVMRTDGGQVYISKDHGKAWKEILKDKEIEAIIPHPYFHDAVYFLTAGTEVFYSVNRGETFDSFKAPGPPNEEGIQTISFHQDYQDWLIWTAAVDCPSKPGKPCHSVAHISEDRGDAWATMLRYVKQCEFIKKEGRGDSKKLVYCVQRRDEKPDGLLQLLSSDNWFADSTTHFDDMLKFATMSEFIVVANKNTDDSLKVDTSVDGQTFADAEFPKNFNVEHQRGYTLLDSSTHAVFLLVNVGNQTDFEYGKLMKSNSNGTSYVHSIGGVSQNRAGYVDFEKMQGLEGVALLNVVDNIDDAGHAKSKKLKTMITHNDGGQWALLSAPKQDAEKKPYGCDVDDINKCSLHLHGYTERKDPRHTFSSASAVGLMMAIGNVGEYLTHKSDADTFITRDGGINWISVKKGSYMWEYGDQGSIIVIVQDAKDRVTTNSIFYSLDEAIPGKDMNFRKHRYLLMTSPPYLRTTLAILCSGAKIRGTVKR